MSWDDAASLEAQIDQWRNYLRQRRALHSHDVAELEDHLREQVATLTEAGLAVDEAFLVAVKRMGDLDALSREFAREHSERLWKQLVIASPDADEPQRGRRDAAIALGAATLAAVVVKLPALFGVALDTHLGFYARNASLFVLPVLAVYFAWKRRLDARTVQWLAVAFAAGAIVANAYPVAERGATETLTALHLPVALWLAVGIAYSGGRWNETAGRMDFIRFTGELFIYYAIIALGGAVLAAFIEMIFAAIGINAEWFFRSWLFPCGAVAALVVAAWLVEAKQSVIENMAPVLTRLFTPLFAVALVTFLGAALFTGRGIAVERNVLIAFDLLLVLVLGLLIYAISARDPQAPPGAFDVLQVVLVVSALAADVVALASIVARISDFGITPNRIAALGENIVLLINLAWSAVLYVQFIRRRGSFASLERWQTNYLPVYAVWAAVVAVVLPPTFGYV